MARSGPVSSSNTGALGGAVGTITISPTMPISGVFGGGNVAFITSTKNFIVPATTIRVRTWGAGGGQSNQISSGSGGGFAMKVIAGLTVGASIAATIGLGGTYTARTGGTTSFGAYVSATGGDGASTAVVVPGGVGVGGDVIASG